VELFFWQALDFVGRYSRSGRKRHAKSSSNLGRKPGVQLHAVRLTAKSAYSGSPPDLLSG
jgi:hypothetical protein